MMLVMNIALALLWASLIGPFNPANILVGFLLGFAVLCLAGAATGATGYARKAFAFVSLVLFTVWELIRANLRVARQTLSSLKDLHPAVLAVPLEPGLTDAEITILANLITLTPGTLSLEVSDDRSHIYVHFMNLDDPQHEIRAIKRGFERRILEVMR